MHEMQAVALAVLYVLMKHAVQLLDAATPEKVPAAHMAQLDDKLAAVVAPYVPALQPSQDVAPSLAW